MAIQTELPFRATLLTVPVLSTESNPADLFKTDTDLPRSPETGSVAIYFGALLAFILVSLLVGVSGPIGHI